jgi:serpin B
MSTSLRILSVMVGVAVLSVGGGGSVVASTPASLAETITAANNAFAVALYARLGEREGNLVFSPYSLSSVLGTASGGARGNTGRQMVKVLRFPADVARSLQPVGDLMRDLRDRGKKEQYSLVVANALWVNKGQAVRPEFLEAAKMGFDTGIREVDFGANPEAGTRSINGWTEKQTSGKVKKLIPAGTLGTSTTLVLSDAAYFQGLWASPFSEDSTSQAPFDTAAGKTVMVTMMAQTGTFKHLGEKSFQVLEMDFSGKGLSLVAILPRDNNGLPELEKTLTPENLNDWLGRLVEKQVSVYFPRCALGSGLLLAGTFTAMGMTDAFLAPSADFSGIDGRRDLAISEVAHQAVVGLSETGAGAATASAGQTEETASFVDTEFAADHPFVFMIRDKQSGMILFMGRVTNPTKP